MPYVLSLDKNEPFQTGLLIQNRQLCPQTGSILGRRPRVKCIHRCQW